MIMVEVWLVQVQRNNQRDNNTRKYLTNEGSIWIDAWISDEYYLIGEQVYIRRARQLPYVAPYPVDQSSWRFTTDASSRILLGLTSQPPTYET